MEDTRLRRSHTFANEVGNGSGKSSACNAVFKFPEKLLRAEVKSL